MRSYSGCLTCRKRKLKCDEVKPRCGHCRGRSSRCVFQERKVFRVSGSFEDDHVWLATPPRLTFIRIEDPYEDDVGLFGSSDLSQVQDASGSPSLADNALHDWHAPPRLETGAAAISKGLDNQNQDSILISRMLHHFSDGPGQWMDVFDTGAYFARKVPLLATSKPLLKSAVCSLAAKHLHHMQSMSSKRHHRSPRSSSLSASGSLDMLEVNDAVDWRYQSAKHYDRAINTLKNEIEQWKFETDEAKREEVLATIAVLCAGELMDEPGEAWRAHLSVLPLFSTSYELASNEPTTSSSPQSVTSGPIFWSLSRQDLLCAFLSQRHTRLDLNDVTLWNRAGLNIDTNGHLQPLESHIDPGDLPPRTLAATDLDTRSNEIHWLLGKIANFIASGDSAHQNLQDSWRGLTQELQQWRQSLPEIFEYTARTSLTHYSKSPETSHLARFEQIWHQVSICAATMQSYHMASILLLVNRPQRAATTVRSSVSERLTAYRNSERQALEHAREMCGISLAGQTDANRIHSVQPLSVAGQVFENEKDRKVVIELLEAIERDTGWRAGHHVERLKALSVGTRDDTLFVI